MVTSFGHHVIASKTRNAQVGRRASGFVHVA